MSDVEFPKVFCPVKDEEVPIWRCLGSLWFHPPHCKHLEEATVNITENWAKVKCKGGGG